MATPPAAIQVDQITWDKYDKDWLYRALSNPEKYGM